MPALDGPPDRGRRAPGSGIETTSPSGLVATAWSISALMRSSAVDVGRLVVDEHVELARGRVDAVADDRPELARGRAVGDDGDPHRPVAAARARPARLRRWRPRTVTRPALAARPSCRRSRRGRPATSSHSAASRTPRRRGGLMLGQEGMRAAGACRRRAGCRSRACRRPPPRGPRARAGRCRPGSTPPTPSSATTTTSASPSRRTSTRALVACGVARHVGQRLGDEEVGRRLDRRGQPLLDRRRRRRSAPARGRRAT